ncbi:hypothetical protein EV383_4120 [Pseudonocardia sediminis]|uniref:DUF1684 domain-containing protein n=1 Tax=Pseudonocardia sediminis TaxID=1397368 RepID=A0A4V2FR51_PSEST|nr:DUF1684 domain-containing protein [Pseudonocardia sediminis]RZT87210.1 hypothetical protein EV383_4120 [Pseudonocardia sediminis]
MTTVESTDLATAWQQWHDEREQMLTEPHGWLSITALHWLDEHPAQYPDLPGTWRVRDADTVEITAAAADAVDVPGHGALDGTATIAPVDGAPGVMVTVGGLVVEIARRTDGYALRVRDPQAVTLTEFSGVPAFPVQERWVVDGTFTAYPQARRITVDAVVEGLQHFPTAVGEVTFDVDGAAQTLVALAGKESGLSLHFRDATSGETTYGGGRILRTADPADDGRVTLDLNRTVNLPCAFIEHATCPLPPAGNTLAVAVEAGERSPLRPDLG